MARYIVNYWPFSDPVSPSDGITMDMFQKILGKKFIVRQTSFYFYGENNRKQIENLVLIEKCENRNLKTSGVFWFPL